MMFVIFLVVFWSSGAFAASEWDQYCDGVEPFTLIPNPFDCKKYIQCMEGGEAFPNDCNPGMAFDITAKNCLPEGNVDCSHITTTIQTTEGTTTVESSSEASTTISSTTESSSSDWDYLCIGIEPNKLVAHPNDCKKFFQCMGTGQAIPGSCSEDQAFDLGYSACLPEGMVDCSHIVTTTENPLTSTSPATSPETTTPEESSTTTESSTTETSTEPPTTTETTTPEESSTDPITTTEATTTEEITTPTTESTTESSSSTETPTTTETTPSTDPSPTPTVTYPPGTSISPGPEIPEPGVQCPSLNKTRDRPVFLASKMDCSKYYLCYIGLPVALKCQEGTHFNQFEENCDDPFYAHCQVNGFIDPNPFPECPRRGKLSLPKVDNCEYFVFCNEGVGSLQKCPFYHGWDIITQTCLFRDAAVCAS